MGPKEYRGRLSTGCEPCRARRVKCDEGKPTCTNCIKSGNHAQCKYRNLVEISFRNESFDTAERAKRTWRARARRSSPEEGGSDNNDDARIRTGSRRSGGNKSLVPSRPITPVMPPLKTDIMDLSLNRFFFDYALPNGTSRPGIFEYLPDFYGKAPETSSLKEAMSAVALANYDRRMGLSNESSRVKMKKHYGNALRLVSKETQDPVARDSDELLLAVQMLGIYEHMSTGGNNPIFQQAHANGLAALLSGRTIPMDPTDPHWRIYQSINAQMLTSSLKLGVPSFIPYSKLKIIYEGSSFPQAQMRGLVHRGVDLIALWKASLESPTWDEPNSHRIQEERASLLEQMNTLNIAFDAWENNAPARYGFTTEPTPPANTQPKWLRPLFEHPGAPRISHRYESVTMIHSWGLWRSIRILVARVLLREARKSIESDPMPYLETMDRIVTDTCRAILPTFVMPIDTKPYAETIDEVCGFRSYMVMLPLRIARASLPDIASGFGARETMAWIDEVDGFLAKGFDRNKPTNFRSTV